MQKLDKEIFHRYLSRLRKLGVSDGAMPHCVKWVRYFLDYEAKYGGGGPRAGLIKGFLEKLASKGQSSGLREQARRAVEVFLDMGAAEGGPAATGEQEWEVAEPSAEVAKKERLSEPRVPAGSDPRLGWRGLETALTGEIKRRNYSPQTMKTYLTWVRRFGQFTRFMPVGEVSDEDAKKFLTDLAVNGQVVASTQNQAFNALLFLFRHILQREYDLKDRVVRAKRSKYIPTVLTKPELDAVLGELQFPWHLIVSMLYGCGLRLSECLELRVNSLDFSQNLVIVHDGKGKKDRSVPMPKKLRPELESQTRRVAKLLDHDLKNPDCAGISTPVS